MQIEWLLYANVALVALAIVAILWLCPGRREPLGDYLSSRFEMLFLEIQRLERMLAVEMKSQREEQALGARDQRAEISQGLKGLAELERSTLEGFARQLTDLTRTLGEGHHSFSLQMAEAQKNASLQMEGLRVQVETQMERIRSENSEKLEKMRETVDEKLQGVLEKRLGESFRLVSERLEQVQKGLGEMQSLANGVGDLKKVLTNVKTRGIWGEIKLGALLEQAFSPEQYLRNAQCREGTQERVEYAVRLPGNGPNQGEVLLPIDAKFPSEDYERLIDCSDRGDAEGVETASKALEMRVKGFARDVSQKYVNPPHTTDFALLFLPTEGLYSELLRRPGLADALQREYRVTLCGPTTLGALLNSLQMGFRTLMIEKRTSEVWEILSDVKTEFSRYGEVLDRVRQKLKEAGDQIDKVDARKRAIERKLRNVAQEPESGFLALPGLAEGD